MDDGHVRLPAPIPATPTGLLIGGEWQSGDGATIEVEDPATERVVASVADASLADARAALDAAAGRQEEWAATPPRERAAVLSAAYAEIQSNREGFASLISLEMGKSHADAMAEVAYGAEFLRWFAEEAVRIEGTFGQAPEGNGRILTARQAVGPSLLITPWNFPLAMATRKVGPAIAAGCTMILKPASQTPLTALLLAVVLEGAGLPPGVLNVLTTSQPAELTGTLLADQRLRKLSFTGSTATGRWLTERASQNLLRVSMELGGNAAFVVLDDADLDRAVEQAMIAKLRNGGQSCTAANRFLVHEDRGSEFAARLAAAMDGLTVGPATDRQVEVGPMIDAGQRDRIGEMVAAALATGARRVTAAPDGMPDAGYFVAPTVLDHVPGDASVIREEVFGPVAPIVSFADDEQALAMANDTEDGLVGFVFSNDIDRCLSFAEALQTGMVGINRGLVSNAAAPFGGVKQSGLGREGGRVGIDEFLDLKYIAL